MDLQAEVRVDMRWQTGQKFLVDRFSPFLGEYIWYLEIEDFTSRNDDGDIETSVQLNRVKGDGEQLSTISCSASELEEGVEEGTFEPIDTLSEDQKTNEPDHI